MVKAAALARTTPVVYVIEDAHWIDGISESMLAEFLTVIPQTPSLVVVTYRPEYNGALAHAPRSQTIALEPLDESQMMALGAELLGEDRSVTELAELITTRAAGNPFFAEEIVRDLSERDVLVGGRGCYLCADPIADVHVPRTLAGGHRRPHRPARPGRQAHTERCGGDRVSVHARHAGVGGYRRRPR